MERLLVRDAGPDDFDFVHDVFSLAAELTTASFAWQPSSRAERRQWFDARLASGFPLLLAEADARPLGFATFTPWNPKRGYRQTVEHTVYLAPDVTGHGVGPTLMEALFAVARARGVHAMIGFVSGENTGSLRFHERLGFVEVGRLPEVGRKFGRWLDLVIVQKTFDVAPDDTP